MPTQGFNPGFPMVTMSVDSQKPIAGKNPFKSLAKSVSSFTRRIGSGIIGWLLE